MLNNSPPSFFTAFIFFWSGAGKDSLRFGGGGFLFLACADDGSGNECLRRDTGAGAGRADAGALVDNLRCGGCVRDGCGRDGCAADGLDVALIKSNQKNESFQIIFLFFFSSFISPCCCCYYCVVLLLAAPVVDNIRQSDRGRFCLQL